MPGRDLTKAFWPRPRATQVRTRSNLWIFSPGKAKVFIPAELSGHGALEAHAYRRPSGAPITPRNGVELHWALVTWRPKDDAGRDPYRPSWSYWGSKEAALAATHYLPADAVWSVIDSRPPPCTGGFDSKAFDELVLELRREARAGERERAVRGW